MWITDQRKGDEHSHLCILNPLLFKLPFCQLGLHVVGIDQWPVQRNALLQHISTHQL